MSHSSRGRPVSLALRVGRQTSGPRRAGTQGWFQTSAGKYGSKAAASCASASHSLVFYFLPSSVPFAASGHTADQV